MILGFAGLAGAGKNEAARAFDYPQFGFADPIKEIVRNIDPCVSFHPSSGMIHLSDLLKYESFELVKRNSKELRRLLQEMGMAVRSINDELWIDLLALRTKNMQSLCITDVRFENEIQFIRHEYWTPGFVIWIDRPGLEQGDHASENSITAEDCDGYVLNNGSIELLHEAVRREAHALYKNLAEQQ